ncbi:MAG: Uma2 family endonuclease [Elainella sp. Prado103]|jgi:Uma2 family endonuclease|nr:Uma2 family endonuclease [Elainella sp. Prado103]
MPKKPVVTEQRVVLPNVSWQQFETLLSELGDERQTRLTYLRGKLEMMTPVEAHDRCSKLIDSLILVLADELKLPLTAVLPVLLKHEPMGCATEPDACYYLENRSQIGHGIDLSQAIPPDLLVEVALTKSSIDKLPIYETMGIPEVWRYITTLGDDMLKGKLLIYHLKSDGYVESRVSQAFPFLAADRILAFLEQSDSMSLATALRVLRSWVQQQQQ